MRIEGINVVLGKTLALLCAALAWQEAEQRKCDEFNSLLERATVNQDPGVMDALMTMTGAEDYEEDSNISPAVNIPGKDHGGGFLPDDDDDFVSNNPKILKNSSESSINYHLPSNDLEGIKPSETHPNYLRMPKKRKCPKIYFGTRTHKQVAQIVRELKKTSYSGVRMTILASREHTCVHPTISKSFNKNQDCQDLMDKRKGGGCRFHANVKSKMSSHHSVRAYIGTDTAWDIEELVKAGKKVRACPYYAVRELKTAAQLVICPYNYLVEPNIRGSMEISLRNQIVILDEAHNIEDSARDAASGSFKLDDVEVAMKDCEAMVEADVLPDIHRSLAEFLSRLCNWMTKCSSGPSDYTDFNSSTRVLTGTSGLAEWNEMVFYPANYYDVKSWLQEALKEQSAAMEQNDEGFTDGATKVLSKKTSDLIGGVFTVLDFMHRKDSSYRDDYKISVVKANERPKGGKGKVKGGWVGRGATPTFVSTITLNFWCLNPGVCFDELLDCRSIVLTSGTLSPMLTFASELEVKFPVSLEANHVIDKSQVWVGTLGTGPTGHSLNAAYQNSNTYGFQDEVGRLILQMCSTIPHGVLVFLPSYKLLNDLTERWKATGLWSHLFERKAIMAEPRFGDELENVMKDFYSVINSTHSGVNDLGQDGALFLAVCRGKVSEGLDFADNNARAVVCVGIPFPAFKDTLVDLKKKYNDEKRSVKPHLLPGRDWYEIQAFRALNQALGRCIRHRRDWGAILMVDDRYGRNPRYVNSLSKWVRGRVVHYSNTNTVLDSLQTFTKEMKHMEIENGIIEDNLEIDKVNAASKNSKDSSYQDELKTSYDLGLGSASSAWSPPVSNFKALENRVTKLEDMRKADKEIKMELPKFNSECHLDSKTNLKFDLDNKSNLNGLGVKTVVKTNESKLRENSFDTLDEAISNKRKHSSTSSECNFDMSNDLEEENTPVEIKNEGSVKQRLSKFRRSEKADPLKATTIDNLPNLNNLGEDINKITSRLKKEPSFSGDNIDDVSDDKDLLNMLEKRRAEKRKEEATYIPESPEFSDDDEFMNNLNFSDLEQKSSKKPLFSSTAANNLRHFPENKEKESHDMFESDDDEMFNFDEKQMKPSLDSADEIEEPDEVVRKVIQPKKKSVLRKKSLSLNNKRRLNKSLLPELSSDDDFK